MIVSRTQRCSFWIAPLVALLFVPTALAAPQAGPPITDGVYTLKNHPDGNAAPPLYGLRLDKLFGDYSPITFDFEHPDASVTMTVAGSTITIEGTVYGGRDLNGAHDPANAGLWDLYFEYGNVVEDVPGDDDLYVATANEGVATGTITARFATAHFANGARFALQDKALNSFTFRLGDKDDDQGHRGYRGISGWGWVLHTPEGTPFNRNRTATADFLFTAHPAPPAPDRYCVQDRVTRPYGFYLPTLDGATSGPYYTITDAVLNENGDGTALMTGTITNDLGASFSVYAELSGRTVATPPGSPKEAGSYTINTSDWVYYTDIEGKLFGNPGGRYDGAVVSFTRRGPSTQIGTGANVFDEYAFGASAWISTVVNAQPTTGVSLSGGNRGDINVRLDSSCEVLSSLGDTVFKDDNRNGVQDGGEQGVAGVNVELFYADPQGTLLASAGTTTTDASGTYSFDNLVPTTYVVAFEPMPSMPFTSQDAGSDDAKDSDADPATGRTDVISLAPNTADLTIDAGVVVPAIACIGDTVFLDTNGNGIQDDGEAGLPGITIDLSDAGTDGLCSTADDRPVGSLTTDASGSYLFNGLTGGTYCVTVDGTTVTDGYMATTPETLKILLPPQETRLDADFGYRLAPVLETDLRVGKTASVATVVPHEPFVYTLEVENLSNVDVTHVTVMDVLPSEVVYIQSSGTGAYDAGTGVWAVGTLAPFQTATLNIVVKAAADIPAPFTNTASLTTSTPSDSNASNDSASATVGPRGGNGTVETDLGVELTVSDASPAVGEVITFTVTVTNNGPADATGVVIQSILPAGVIYQTSSLPAAYDATNGIWTIGDLSVGETVVLTIAAKVVITNMLQKFSRLVGIDQSDTKASNNTADVVLKAGSYGGVGGLSLALCSQANNDTAELSDLVVTAIQGLIVTPSGNLVAATYGRGVLISEDGGTCWRYGNEGLTNPWVMDIVQKQDGTLFIGTWADGLGGIWRSDDGGNSWTYITLGNRQVLAIEVDPRNDDILYAGINSVIDALYISTDGGATWAPTGNFALPIWAIAINPTVTDNVVLGTALDSSAGGVFFSADGGRTFDLNNTGLGNTRIRVLQFVGSTLYAGTDDGIYTFDGNAWARFGDGLNGHRVLSIAFDGSTFYAGSGTNGLYILDGSSWEQVGLAETAVTSIVALPNGEVLVGTEGLGFVMVTGVSVSTSIQDESSATLPGTVALQQNYPNPFNPRTTIGFTLRETTHVRVAVYDMLGRTIATLVDGVMPAGSHQVPFDAADIPTGTYLYRMDTAQQQLTRTMVLMK